MSWLSVEDAAQEKRISIRHLWRLIKEQKLMTDRDESGKIVVWVDKPVKPESLAIEEIQKLKIELPLIPLSRITEDVMKSVLAMQKSIAFKEYISEQEENLAAKTGLPVSSQRHNKAEIRRLYNLPDNVPISVLSTHPQIRSAIEYILTRKVRTDRGDLRSARGLVVVKDNGEYLSVSDFLLAIYSWEGHNALSCYRALKARMEAGRVMHEENGARASAADLPAKSTVSMWLRTQLRTNRAIKRARMTKARWEAEEQIYVSRNPEEFRVGGKLIGDHTELDTIVYRNDGKVAALWLTAWIDFRTGLLRGWELAYAPNSNTIAVSFKRAVMGSQLMMKTERGYQSANIMDLPDIVSVDNGKDYKSRYTKQVCGKVDFNDEARRTIQRITELHYATKHHPQSKAQMERWFGVIQQITKYLPGYKGAKYQDKPDELKAQIERGTILTEDQFRKLFEKAVNAYNNRARKQLENMSPLEYTLVNQRLQRHVDPRVLDFLMMKTARDRKIVRGYVRALGEEFFSSALADYNGKYATLYYDPADVGTMVVYVGGEFVAATINKKLYGMSERDWIKVLKERAQINKTLRSVIHELHQDITSDEAKAMLYDAEAGNAKVVPPEIRQKTVPAVVVMMGIEGEAKKAEEMVSHQKQVEEAEKKRKEIVKANPLSLAQIGKMK